MIQRINKAKLTKQYIGEVIKEYGFEYAGSQAGIIWLFERQKNGVKQGSIFAGNAVHTHGLEMLEKMLVPIDTILGLVVMWWKQCHFLETSLLISTYREIKG